MLSRDILEEQELEYALSLIEDMEREDAELAQTNQAGVEEQRDDQVDQEDQVEQQRENQMEDEVERNPSPRTLREMRRAYFEGLESRRTETELVKSDRSNPTGQTEPTRRTLRSGRSY